MKKLFILLAIATTALGSATADERPIEFSQLPKVAQEFITKHFAGVGVIYANVDREVMDTEYEVRLEDGTKLELNGRGEWKDISNKRTGIPEAVVPAKIAKYIKERYPQQPFISIERDRHDYEVKLANGIELTFSTDGRLIGFDD